MPDKPPPQSTRKNNDTPLRPDRRSFLRVVGVSGAASTIGLAALGARAALPADGDDADEAATDARAHTTKTPLKINGRMYRLELDTRTTLLDALREHIGLTGTKKGCDHGQCGACTVHVNGRRVNACLSLAVMHAGDAITTIEGLGRPGKLHPMQRAFLEHDGYQCGYCTSGQIMSAAALLHEPVGHSDDEVRQAMSGNICRCGAYKNILGAIKQVRES